MSVVEVAEELGLFSELMLIWFCQESAWTKDVCAESLEVMRVERWSDPD